MEWVYGGDFDVVVDFAHTPNALEETLQPGPRTGAAAAGG